MSSRQDIPSGVPQPSIRLYRLIHVDVLPTLLKRGALHAPNHTPDDGLAYRTIHNASVQLSRLNRRIPCSAGGNCHDYVPFYFGPLSVMLLNLKTGRVPGYSEGQEPLIYLTTTLARIQQAGCRFVFSDGHGLATFTNWYEDLSELRKVDWNVVGERYWSDRPDDNDRQRRKQAEFLIWRWLDWALIEGIGVLNDRVKRRVEAMLASHPSEAGLPVEINAEWYYY